ncbi:bacterioferritin-associated ferredoxin [Pleomorphomonas sp. PLEO]|uniref:(2Fe-2S)-binding protein n=1 Tax=Pleomorphomonas sp. PLEO TaxID=3239306 RepID=UPI00351E38F3
MIVCHCNVLTVEDIQGAVDELLTEMPLRVITPGLVYRRLGTRGRCCGCFPLAIDVINSHIEQRLAADDLAERRQQIVEQQRAYRENMPNRRRVAADA